MVVVDRGVPCKDPCLLVGAVYVQLATTVAFQEATSPPRLYSSDQGSWSDHTKCRRCESMLRIATSVPSLVPESADLARSADATSYAQAPVCTESKRLNANSKKSRD